MCEWSIEFEENKIYVYTPGGCMSVEDDVLVAGFKEPHH